MSATTTSNEFMTLAEPHMGRLFRIGMRLTHQPSEAQDLVQEALTRGWANWHRFSKEGRLGAWLSRILVNAFISRHRHQKVVDNTAARPDLLVHLFDPNRIEAAAKPEKAWQSEGFGDEVVAALNRLPEAYRDVVVLVDIRGLAYKEAAAELACPVGTVMSRLHRARRQLREGLRGYAAEYGLGLQDEKKASTTSATPPVPARIPAPSIAIPSISSTPCLLAA